jgi:vacuolar-type H+-ATPase subunit H
MPQGKETQRSAINAFFGVPGVTPVLGNPMMAILAEMNGTLLESVATAQKDWVNFVHQRLKEDIAASRQLMKCQSLAEMHQVYSEYLQTAFEQYQQQSERVVQRGESMAQHLAENAETAAKESVRARH